ncbi:glycerate kinase [Domibacillus sp. DTU_2020_1001157_1_SI_ALB_TIR_016]|uniref:glycerate kinase n=1 Tax=Domibacillus sp. DTU_2020_1001157_1_SI_ALB_TIR_016 TaxID=3077789 RepID=UPI0028F1109E|nr:glycerate kinase [Domibacillus sp. DTU_2020_1001157_1_SI_ALB_TIR_016]WNS79020.1 glycerate kinase [Domibacillus sp. DTU_2020_1001157_1_SI_ALB_TIR_016]
MEKVLIAINSFKRSISFTKGNEAISLGVKDIYPEGEIMTLSLADDGEGTIYNRQPYRQEYNSDVFIQKKYKHKL